MGGLPTDLPPPSLPCLVPILLILRDIYVYISYIFVWKYIEILLNQPEIRLYLPFSDRFWTKRTSVWSKINRRIVNTILYRFDILRFRKYFSMCRYHASLIIEGIRVGPIDMVFRLPQLIWCFDLTKAWTMSRIIRVLIKNSLHQT